jgi:hypothetical protein
LNKYKIKTNIWYSNPRKTIKPGNRILTEIEINIENVSLR